MILQYLLFEICIEEARFSKSVAIFFDMLIPIVLVPFPMGFVAINNLPFNSYAHHIRKKPNKSTLLLRSSPDFIEASIKYRFKHPLLIPDIVLPFMSPHPPL